jgi:DNA-binding beta-propeller fold protein YncE
MRPPCVRTAAILAVCALAILGSLAAFRADSGPTERPVLAGAPSSVPAPPARSVRSAAAPAGAPASWAGSTLATLLPNYNASLPGNFRSLVDDWQVGTPATVPGSDVVWWPQIAVAVNGSPAKVAAPALVFNLSLDSVTGIDPDLSNVSAFAYNPANGLMYATESYNNSVVALNASDGLPTGVVYPVGSDPTGIIYDSLTHDLFVANTGSGNVTVINPEVKGSAAIAWTGIAVGKEPFQFVDVPGADSVYVANGGSGYLARLNTSDLNGPVIDTGLNDGPASGIAYSTKTGYVAVVASSSDNLTIVSAKTGDVVTSTVTVGTGYRSIVVDGAGSGFVAANASGSSLVVINVSSFAVNSTRIGVGLQPTQIEVVGGPTAVVWNNGSRTFSSVNVRTGAVGLPSPTVGPEPALIAYDPVSGNLFVGDSALPGVEILNPFSGANVSGPIRLTSAPTALAVDPALGVLYVGESGGVLEFNTSTEDLDYQDTLLPGANGPIVPDVAAGVTWVGRPAQGTAVALNASTLAATGISVPVQLGSGASYSMALDPADGILFGINSTTDKISEFNATTGVVQGSPVSAGKNVTALAWDPADGVICAIGDDLEAIDPQTMSVNLSAVALTAHTHVGGVVYEPSREALYIGTWTSSPYSGSLSVVNGSSPGAFRSSLTVISTGFEPSSLATLGGLYDGLADSGVVLVGNAVSGTVSVVGSPPEIESAAFAPSTVDVNATTSLSVVATGGAGGSTATFAGQPAGCVEVPGLTLNCTPTEAGSFEVLVTISDALNDSATAVASLTVDSALVVSAAFGLPRSHETDEKLAESMSAQAVGGTGSYAYAWSFGDGSMASGPTVSHSYAEPGEYVVAVTATDSGGGRAVNETVILVESDPSVQLTANATTTDVGESVGLESEVDGGAAPGSGLWEFGDGTTSPLASVSHEWDRAGVYAVNYTFTDAVGATVKQSLSILVNPVLTGQFLVTPLSSKPTVGTTFDFNASLVGGTSPYTVTWSFGDGSSAVGGKVTHAYGAAGTYVVQVVAVDTAGGSVNTTFHDVVVGSGPSGSGPLLGGGFGPSFLVGLVVGGTAAAVAMFLAERRRRAGPAGPPSPYVPPQPIDRSGRP